MRKPFRHIPYQRRLALDRGYQTLTVREQSKGAKHHEYCSDKFTGSVLS